MPVKEQIDTPYTKVAAVILAAGLGSRMGGQCKALMRFDSKNILEIAVERLRRAWVSEIVVVTGSQSAKVAQIASKLGCSSVLNIAYTAGMFSSVLTGVRALKSNGAFFILPCDTPLVKPETLFALSNRFHENPNTLVAYPTFCGDRGHPPIISPKMKGHIKAWDGDGGLRALLAQYERYAIDLPCSDRAVTLDMDTPEDYEKLSKYYAREYIPDEEECAELLREAGTPQEVIAHTEVVTRVADAIAAALTKNGDIRKMFDRDLLKAAALLHDIAKAEKDHAARGAKWLRDRGYDEIASIIAQHNNLPRKKYTGEAEILYLADRLVDGRQITKLEDRMSKMEARFARDEIALKAARYRMERAEEIKAKVEKIAGKSLAEIL